jgi:hypothetical protein
VENIAGRYQQSAEVVNQVVNVEAGGRLTRCQDIFDVPDGFVIGHDLSRLL